MKRTVNVKQFEVKFDDLKKVDIDLLEQQLHSLYKLKNINFDERSFFNDLKQCNIAFTSLRIAKKSFIKAISMALEKYGITIENFDITTVQEYSSYELKPVIDKGFFARNLRKELREGIDNVNGKKLNIWQRGYRVPLVVFAHIPTTYMPSLSDVKNIDNERITKSAAYKKTLDDLMTWEKDIIERLVSHIRIEYKPPKKD